MPFSELLQKQNYLIIFFSIAVEILVCFTDEDSGPANQ